MAEYFASFSMWPCTGVRPPTVPGEGKSPAQARTWRGHPCSSFESSLTTREPSSANYGSHASSDGVRGDCPTRCQQSRAALLRAKGKLHNPPLPVTTRERQQLAGRSRLFSKRWSSLAQGFLPVVLEQKTPLSKWADLFTSNSLSPS